MPDQEKLAKTIEGLKELRSHFRAMAGISSSRQERANHIESARTIEDAIAVLKDFEHISFEGTFLNREDYVNIGDIIDCLSGLAWEKDAAFHVVGLIEWAMGKRAITRDEILKAQEPHWISVEDGLPQEHDTLFARFYGTDKWRNGMFVKVSDDVRVAKVFPDGTKMVHHDHTVDGRWASERKGLDDVYGHVTHWMPNPELPFCTSRSTDEQREAVKRE